MAAPSDTLVSDARAVPRRMAAAPWRTAAATFVGIELLVLFAPTLQWLYSRWTMSVWQNAHGLFVPPLVAWLIHVELRARPHLRQEPGSALGFLWLVPALWLHMLDAGMHTQLLSAVALVAALPGLSLLFLGTRRTMAIAFPLTFCLFAIPIPLALTEAIHLELRQITASATAVVLPWLGYPVFLEGTTLHLTTARLHVVEACSGFSTLYAAMAAACLVAYSTSSPRRRLLVLAAAAPIAIASNIIRVSGLSLLIVWYGIGILETIFHPLSGLMTFAISLPLIFWLGGPAKRDTA
jgi:exosortase